MSLPENRVGSWTWDTPWEGWARTVGVDLAEEQHCDAAAVSAGSVVFASLCLKTCSSACPHSSRSAWDAAAPGAS